MPVTLMVALGKAALNVGGAGLIGDAAEIAKAAWEYWKKSPEERLDELEAAVRADDEEVERAAEQVVAELAPSEPEAVRMKLATFLKQVPARIRQSQRRPADPTGRTLRPGLVVRSPEDMISFVPDQLPRFKAGDRPLANWVLVELLGIGGFGEVWRARHAHLQSRAPVALKFCTDAQARRFLKHEAKVIDRVMLQGQHPGIVRLQDAYLDADPPCLQYDYVDGGDLGGLILDWHRQAEKPSPAQLARRVLQLAEIVAFAHRLDPPIVHRDLKPANILVQRGSDGAIRFQITDFGIGGIATARAIQAARVPTSPREFLTTAVRGSGTILYSSPEQLKGFDPDPRDDVHALGVIWYQIMSGDLTGKPSAAKGWRRRFLAQGMSDAMLELLESCFEEQNDRPANAAVLAEKLGEVLQPPVELPKKEKSSGPAEPKAMPRAEPPKEVVNSIDMKMKLIPAGEFPMGSTEADDEKPMHLVTISQPFYLGVYPLTQRDCMQVMKKNPSHFSGHERLPVENVSWFDAVAFCNALSRKEGLPPFYAINGQTVEVPDWNGPGYRLPTEAEWENACRAGMTTRFSFGDNEEALGEYAWYFANSNGQTHPVREKKANAFDLHDMHGNVWEWCWDGYAADYYEQSPAVDPRGPERAAPWVIRGGSWSHAPGYARSAYRYGYTPGFRNSLLGFRLVRFQSGR